MLRKHLFHLCLILFQSFAPDFIAPLQVSSVLPEKQTNETGTWFVSDTGKLQQSPSDITAPPLDVKPQRNVVSEKVVMVKPPANVTEFSLTDEPVHDVASYPAKQRLLEGYATKSKNVSGAWDIIDAFLTNGYRRHNHSAFITRYSSGGVAMGASPSADVDRDTEVPLMEMSLQQCPEDKGKVFTGSRGLVTGLTWEPDSAEGNSGTLYKCSWKITVPVGLFVSVAVRLPPNCCEELPGTRFDAEETTNEDTQQFGCDERFVAISSSNQIILRLEFAEPLINTGSSSFRFDMLFLATETSMMKELRVVSISSLSGHLATPGYGIYLPPKSMNASYTVSVPDGYSVMVSFHRFSLRGELQITSFLRIPARDFVTLSTIDKQGQESVMWTKTGQHNIPTEFYNSSIRIHFTNAGADPFGFKMHFSLHQLSALPRVLPTGLFDCSEPAVYARFQHHVHCNLQRECQGGEDEGPHCPFSSPACNGSVAVADKCFVYNVSPSTLSWHQAKERCEMRDGQLAIIRNDTEYRVFLDMIRAAKNPLQSYVGLTLNNKLSRMYSNTPVWDDGTVSYRTTDFRDLSMSLANAQLMGFFFDQTYINDRMIPTHPNSSDLFPYVCEHRVTQNLSESQLLPANLNSTIVYNLDVNPASQQSLAKGSLRFAVCPSGHLTHAFLACDVQAVCHAQYYLLQCPLHFQTKPSRSEEDVAAVVSPETLKMFACVTLGQTFPYTVVCDFIIDCWDGSDESFCRHNFGQCKHYECENSQCFTSRIRCDKFQDCNDNSDEDGCFYFNQHHESFVLHPPARVDFTQKGTFTMTAINASDACPETHFSCPANLGYCLPVYVRCNGLYDCPGHEDEDNCDSYTCPGFYRCRDSIVCVHVDQVCDGVTQCPKQDDELLCDATCPPQCVCQGLAFICHQPFPAHSFPSLRYLDASHSGMVLDNLANNTYLVWLSLAACAIRVVPSHQLPNLQSLDMSHNEIHNLSFEFVMSLSNLKEMILSGNPLVSLTKPQSDAKQSLLKMVDLSACRLPIFDCDAFFNFPEIISLNLSHNHIPLTIGDNRFTSMPYLKELDLRGTDVEQRPVGIFDGLESPEVIFSQNYRHCCSDVLPESSQGIFCFAPFSGLSSCDDLLRLDLHRGLVWAMAFAASLGNIGCLAWRFLQHTDTRGSPLKVFLTNLNAANFLMGVYQLIIAVMDLRFRGDFLLQEDNWVKSFACSTAGSLSLAATEASSFFTFLVALDRFSALCFSSGRFQKRSAFITCCVSWIIALGLAALPWLPGMSGTEIYTGTNICTALPSLSDRMGGDMYPFLVLVVLNTLLALATAFCQTLVYREVRSQYVMASISPQSQDVMLARRVMTMVITDVICWFGIGVTGLLSSLGVAGVGREVLMTVAVLVIPLKPALNPALFMLSCFMERKRQKAEARLEMLFRAQSKAKKSTLPTRFTKPLPSVPRCRGDVFRFLKHCLGSNCASFQDIEKVLIRYEENSQCSASTG